MPDKTTQVSANGGPSDNIGRITVQWLAAVAALALLALALGACGAP